MMSTIDLSKRTLEPMTELTAKPVVKDKFWIVEEDGEKIATIQAVEEGGFVYVHEDRREQFASIKMLSKEYNIVFDKMPRKKKEPTEAHQVYGWPTDHKPYNPLFDVSRRLPVYTKTNKSKSYFCAGYYIVKFNNTWTKAYCPKLITLQRYQFRGPWHTKEQQQEHLRNENG